MHSRTVMLKLGADCPEHMEDAVAYAYAPDQQNLKLPPLDSRAGRWYH